jgi:hypothetical protein
MRHNLSEDGHRARRVQLGLIETDPLKHPKLRRAWWLTEKGLAWVQAHRSRPGRDLDA